MREELIQEYNTLQNLRLPVKTPSNTYNIIKKE